MYGSSPLRAEGAVALVFRAHSWAGLLGPQQATDGEQSRMRRVGVALGARVYKAIVQRTLRPQFAEKVLHPAATATMQR